MLKEINAKLLSYMKGGDKAAAQALKMLKAEIITREKDKSSAGAELSDESILGIIRKQIKQREESFKIYSEAGRSEQAASEKFEAGILSELLPAQMSDKDLEVLVASAISEHKAETMRDMGKVIQSVTQLTNGQADKARIAQITKRLLS